MLAVTYWWMFDLTRRAHVFGRRAVRDAWSTSACDDTYGETVVSRATVSDVKRRSDPISSLERITTGVYSTRCAFTSPHRLPARLIPSARCPLIKPRWDKWSLAYSQQLSETLLKRLHHLVLLSL